MFICCLYVCLTLCLCLLCQLCQLIRGVVTSISSKAGAGGNAHGSMCHVSGPAEGLGAALHAAAVSAGLRCSQRVRMLPATISLLSTLRAAVPPRRHDAGGGADRRRGRRHPYPGQTQRRGGALSEPTPPAPPRIQEPGGRDPDDGQEG